MDHPEVGMVDWKTREYLCCLEVVLHGSFMIVEVLHEFEEIRVGNCVGDVVFSHLDLSDGNGFKNFILETLCLS